MTPFDYGLAFREVFNSYHPSTKSPIGGRWCAHYHGVQICYLYILERDGQWETIVWRDAAEVGTRFMENDRKESTAQGIKYIIENLIPKE